MKAEELFVGALVRVNRDGLCIKKDTIIEVRAVDADDKLIEKGLVGSAHCRTLDDNQFDGGIWCEYLDPIPLTPEILEKNGLVFDGLQTWELNEKRFDIYVVPVQPNNEWWDKYSTRIEVCTPKADLLIEAVEQIFVHQLQQFLRLCGIDKEIVL